MRVLLVIGGLVNPGNVSKSVNPLDSQLRFSGLVTITNPNHGAAGDAALRLGPILRVEHMDRPPSAPRLAGSLEERGVNYSLDVLTLREPRLNPLPR